jgi:hypothetical protein
MTPDPRNSTCGARNSSGGPNGIWQWDVFVPLPFSVPRYSREMTSLFSEVKLKSTAGLPIEDIRAPALKRHGNRR